MAAGPRPSGSSFCGGPLDTHPRGRSLVITTSSRLIRMLFTCITVPEPRLCGMQVSPTMYHRQTYVKHKMASLSGFYVLPNTYNLLACPCTPSADVLCGSGEGGKVRVCIAWVCELCRYPHLDIQMFHRWKIDEYILIKYMWFAQQRGPRDGHNIDWRWCACFVCGCCRGKTNYKRRISSNALQTITLEGGL